MTLKPAILATAFTLLMSQLAQAATIKIISGGAFKQVLNALAAQYEKETGNQLDITYQTVGQHLDLIKAGKEEFDVAVLTPEAIDGPGQGGQGRCRDQRRAGQGRGRRCGQSRGAEARHRDGRGVQAGAARRQIGRLYRSQGRRIERDLCRGLLQRLGIADQVNAKAVLVHGGAVADHIADGEAEIGVHQISEILPVEGVSWSAHYRPRSRISPSTPQASARRPRIAAAAKTLVKFLAGPHALKPIIEAQGHGSRRLPEIPQNDGARPNGPGAQSRMEYDGRDLGARLFPGDALDVAARNADIGQFAVAEVRKLVHGDPISLPCMEEADNG